MGTTMSLPPVAGTVLYQDSQHTSARERLGAAFQRAMAFSRSPAKELARVIGRTPKGAEMLLRGEVAPSVETLIAACRELDDVWETFRELCGRANTESEAEQLLAQIAQSLRGRHPS